MSRRFALNRNWLDDHFGLMQGTQKGDSVDIDYYIQIAKRRKKPGKHLLADNVVVFSAFYTVSSNPKIIYGFLMGYTSGGNYCSSCHKVEFDAAGKLLHHYYADAPGCDYFSDRVTTDPCDLKQTAQETSTFEKLAESSESWFPGCTDDDGPPVFPGCFDEFVCDGKRSSYFSAMSQGLDIESMYDLCAFSGHRHGWYRSQKDWRSWMAFHGLPTED